MSWGVALRNAVGLGLGGIPSLLNAPPYAKLAFNFLSGELDSRITFSRTSNATLIGSDGTLQYAPHNLLTYSEQFDNAAWTKAQSTITSNSVTAPDGTTTADKLVEDATNSQHVLFRSTSISLNTTHAASGYFKAGERTRINFRLLNGTFNSGANVTFDLSAGTTPFSSLIGTATNLLFSITPVGDGWYRCSVSCVVDATSTAGVWAAYLVNTGNNDTYTGDGTSGIYVWGAQLNVDALQPYYSTTVKNLLGYSQEFDNAAWTKSNSTITANVTAAPDGSVTADKLVENTASSTHPAFQAASVVSGTRYTFSVYVKAGERSFCRVEASGAAMTAGAVNVNLTTGATSNDGSVVASSATLIGNGWYRIQVTSTAGSTGSGNFVVYPATALGGFNYTGDGTSGIYIWGAQFSDSASLDPYVYNPAAAPSNTAYYGPRFDYDPVTLEPKGLLIEEQRTNLALNSGDALSGGTGGVVVANQITAPDGSLADFFREDTSNGEHYAGDRTATVTAGTLYTWAFYAKLGLTGGARRVCVRTGLQGPANVIFDLETGSSTVLAPVVSSGISSAGNGWWRCWIVYTPTGTGTALFRQQLANGVSTVYTGDGTSGLFFWGAQLEVGAFPTSYIPTTTTAATRAADVASVTGDNFSNWYNQSEGTLYFEGSVVGSTGADQIGLNANNNAFTERVRLGKGPTTPRFTIVDDGIVQADLNGGTWAVNAVKKLAGAYAANSIALSVDGATPLLDTVATIPTPTQLQIGNEQLATFLNGHIRTFKYYPTRLSNGQLQTLTK